MEYDDILKICPNCDGNEQIEVISLNPAADRVSAAIKDGLFLVMCILMTVSCVLGFSPGGIPVLNILFTIFMWLSYSQTRKGMLDSTYLRLLSGTTFASYVINYVLAGCIALTGIGFSLISSVIAQTPDLLEELKLSLDVEYPTISEFVINLIKNSGGIIAGIFIVIAALVVVLNIFCYGKIHKFAKSVYQSIDMNTIGFQNVTLAKVWLYIIGGLGILSAVFNMNAGGITMIAELCTALSAIFAGVLIGKYLQEEN